VRRRAYLTLAAFLTVLGCAGHRADVQAAPSRAWTSALAFAKDAVATGRYHDADSALLAFGTRHPDTREAGESEFWRALFALDPRNANHSASDAIQSLTAYAASPEPRVHDAEAGVLRRTADAMVALREATAAAASEADSARTEADSVRTQADSARLARAERTRGEVQRLRDSLDKVVSELAETNQELDRIKKRLAAPKP
jgi:hypothetical protein